MAGWLNFGAVQTLIPRARAPKTVVHVLVCLFFASLRESYAWPGLDAEVGPRRCRHTWFVATVAIAQEVCPERPTTVIGFIL